MITAPQADFVAACRYAPVGVRSCGPTRASLIYPNYHATANDRVMTFAMIETAEGLANAEAIAATPGLTGIFIGKLPRPEFAYLCRHIYHQKNQCHTLLLTASVYVASC